MATKEKPSQLLFVRGFASVRLHVDSTPAGWPNGGTFLIRWRTVFEPFDKTQGRPYELGRSSQG